MLKIFAANGSIALASVILLEEVEADYELSVLDFSRNEQKEAAYQAVNPKEDEVISAPNSLSLFLKSWNTNDDAGKV